MDIHEHQHGAVTVMRPDGAVNQAEADMLKERLSIALERSLGRLVVDMSDVPFVDSRGLEVLVDVSEELAQSGQVLKLCQVNETLREVLDLTGVGSHFEQYDEVNAAVRSFL